MVENIIVDGDDNCRLDIYLSEIYKDYSRSQISKGIKAGGVMVNGRRVKPSYLVLEGDSIRIDYIEEKYEILPENIPLDIIYEDDFLLVVNKPSGMVVHPGVGNMSNTLVNGLLNYTDKLSRIGGDFRPGIVHRLDKDTSGLLVVAKDDDSHNFLSSQLVSRTMKREYLALVDGNLKEDKGSIEEPIGRDPKNRLKMCVSETNSKDALTNYSLLESFDRYSLIKASLYTGRMHQIRVHMSYIGHPIVGDSIYGRSKNEFNIKEQLLHSYKIGFVHPHTKEYMEIENRESKDMNRVLNILRKRRSYND